MRAQKHFRCGAPAAPGSEVVYCEAPPGAALRGHQRAKVTDRGQLRLYVTGSTLLSTRAVENINWLIEEELAGMYEFEVVDVLERPDLADEDGIFATPALVRRSPLPIRKLIGDLSDRDLVLSSLRFGSARDWRGSGGAST